MSTHLLTPQMAGLLERIQRAQRKPLYEMTAQEARLAYRVTAEVLDLPRAAVHEVRDLRIPQPAGHDCAARLYRPAPGTLPVLLYLHGGGFVIGGLETHDSLCRQLALRSGAAVLALDYRLAPEHPFPAAWDDTWRALQWLMQHAGEFDLDPTRVAIGGDSAGGTLAAATALRVRDAGQSLALQLLITPGACAHGEFASRRLFARGFLLEEASIAWFFDQVIPHHHRSDPRFAPLAADDLEGVAPACVLLAECDPLVDEGIAYADRLRAAAVPVQLELYRGLTHDFIKMGRALREAATAQQAAGDALRAAFNPSQETLPP